MATDLFRVEFRMNQRSFWFLLARVEDHPAFSSTAPKQHPVELQLHLARPTDARLTSAAAQQAR